MYPIHETSPNGYAHTPAPGDVWIVDLGRQLKTRPCVVLAGAEESPNGLPIVLKCTLSPRRETIPIESDTSGLSGTSNVVADDPIYVPPRQFVKRTGQATGFQRIAEIATGYMPRTIREAETNGPRVASIRYEPYTSRGRKKGPGIHSPSPKGGRSHYKLYSAFEAALHTSDPKTVIMPKKTEQPHLDFRKIPQNITDKCRDLLRSLAESHYKDLPENKVNTYSRDLDFIALVPDFDYRIIALRTEQVPEEYAPLALGGLVAIEVASMETFSKIKTGYDRTSPRFAKGIRTVEEAAKQQEAWLGLVEEEEDADPFKGHDPSDLMPFPYFAQMLGALEEDIPFLAKKGRITAGPTVPGNKIGVGDRKKVPTVVIDEKAEFEIDYWALFGGWAGPDSPDDIAMRFLEGDDMRDAAHVLRRLPGMADAYKRSLPQMKDYIDSIPDVIDVPMLVDAKSNKAQAKRAEAIREMTTRAANIFDDWTEPWANAVLYHHAMWLSVNVDGRGKKYADMITEIMIRSLAYAVEKMGAFADDRFWEAEFDGVFKAMMGRTPKRPQAEVQPAPAAPVAAAPAPAPVDEDDPRSLFYAATDLDINIAKAERRRSIIVEELRTMVIDPEEEKKLKKAVEKADAAVRGAREAVREQSKELQSLEHQEKDLQAKLKEVQAKIESVHQKQEEARNNEREANGQLEESRLALSSLEAPDTSALENEEQFLVMDIREMKKEAARLRERANEIIAAS